MILRNIKTYGLSLVYIAGYILLAGVLQLVMHDEIGTYSMCIANCIMVAVSFGLYHLLKVRNQGAVFLQQRIPSDEKRQRKFIVLWLMLCYFMITIALYLSAAISDAGMELRQETFMEQTQQHPLLFLFSSIVVAPVAEEVMMRLFLYHYMKSTSHWIVAMIVSSFLFGILHATIAHTIFATLFGCLLVLIFENTGRKIYMPIICHLLYNLIVTLSGDGDMYPYHSPVMFGLSLFVLFVVLIVLTVQTNHAMIIFDFQKHSDLVDS